MKRFLNVVNSVDTEGNARKSKDKITVLSFRDCTFYVSYRDVNTILKGIGPTQNVSYILLMLLFVISPNYVCIIYVHSH